MYLFFNAITFPMIKWLHLGKMQIEIKEEMFFEVMNAHKHQQLWRLIMKYLALIWHHSLLRGLSYKSSAIWWVPQAVSLISTHWHIHAVEIDVLHFARHSALLTYRPKYWHDTKNVLLFDSSFSMRFLSLSDESNFKHLHHYKN